MQVFLQVIVALICLFFVWRIYSLLKANPEMLSKQNLSQSVYTMGVLALVLIGLVVMMVMSIS